MDTLHCYACGQDLPPQAFAADKTHRTGKRSLCDKCASDRFRDWYLLNKSRVINRILRNRERVKVIKAGGVWHDLSSRIDGKSPLRVFYELTTRIQDLDSVGRVNKSKHGKPIGDAEAAEIRKQYEAGRSYYDIAKSTHRDSRTVRAAIVQAGAVIRPRGGLTCKSHRPKVKMICANCGAEFEEYASKRPKPLKFCKRLCGLEYQKQGRGRMIQADIEREGKPEQPLNVVYDPVRKEIYNA